MLFTTRAFGRFSRMALLAIALLCWTAVNAGAQTSQRSQPAKQGKIKTQTKIKTTSQPVAAKRKEPSAQPPVTHTPSAPKRTSRTAAQLVSGRTHIGRTFVPAHQRTTDTSVRIFNEPTQQSAEEVEGMPDQAMLEEAMPDQAMLEEMMSEQGDILYENEGMGPAMSDCGCTGPCMHQQGCLIPCPGRIWENMELFGGAHGFTGPVNRGETGSFGFDEGVNWGAPVPCLCTGELGMQFGMRATHSNFSGAESTGEERSQIFATGGLFRRVDWGFQGGVVVDYLREDWYLEADLVQLRGELSWVYPCCHEIGFWFTTNTQHDTVVSSLTDGNSITTHSEELTPTDLYAFFYRYRVNENGSANGRVFAGFTGESDGLVGADMNVPLNDCWAVQSGFAYLIPEESSSSGGHIEESWNFALGLVWRPGGGFMCGKNYYRPLFDVASNGTFMVDRD